MQREIENRAKKDEQDILWEELEEQFESIRKAYKKGLVNLNQVVIEKSALYLKVENYIDNVKDKTEIKDTEAERKLKHRILRRYKTNKIADSGAIRLTSGVDEFLMKSTDLEDQSAKKKYRNSAIEVDEEIKIPDDLTESHMSNNFLINFEKLDNEPIQLKEAEDEEICSPINMNPFKPESCIKEVSEDNYSEQDSISKIQFSKSRQGKLTDVENDMPNKASRVYQPQKSSFKKLNTQFIVPGQVTDHLADKNSKELQDFYKEIHKVSMNHKRKGIGRKVKIGAIHDQPIKRKRNKKVQNKILNQTDNYQNKLEKSINLESMLNPDTFGKNYRTMQDRTENNVSHIQRSDNMLFVKSSRAKGEKFDTRYQDSLSSEIDKDNGDQNLDIQVQDFEELQDDDYNYTQNKIDKSKGIYDCNYLDQDEEDDESKIYSAHIQSKFSIINLYV